MNHIAKIKPLRELIIESGKHISKLEKALKLFECKQDKDIENFLRYESIRYEKTGKARTYLIIANGIILAYFTLSINSITFDKGIDKKVKQILDYESDRKQFKYMKKPFVPAILLALFGKDSDKFNEYIVRIGKPKSKISDIAMPMILSIVKKVNIAIGGQVIYLDCEKDKSLIKFYESFKFSKFRDNEYDKNLTQMMRLID
jgi:hypothetical protein